MTDEATIEAATREVEQIFLGRLGYSYRNVAKVVIAAVAPIFEAALRKPPESDANLVEVAARHIHAFLYGYEGHNPDSDPDDEDRHIAGIVIAAVTPLIAAQAREEALEEADSAVVEMPLPDDPHTASWQQGFARARNSASKVIRALKEPQT